MYNITYAIGFVTIISNIEVQMTFLILPGRSLTKQKKRSFEDLLPVLMERGSFLGTSISTTVSPEFQLSVKKTILNSPFLETYFIVQLNAVY